VGVGPLPFFVGRIYVEGKILSIDDMVSADDIKYHTEPVPEWGGVVCLASSSAGTVLKWMKDEGQRGLHLFVMSLVDRVGPGAIRIGNLERDVPRFEAKNHEVLNRLIRATLELNGLRKKPEEVVSDAKNDSSGTEIAASPTVSPSNSVASTSTPRSSRGSGTKDSESGRRLPN
jgi:hypothetical protein